MVHKQVHRLQWSFFRLDQRALHVTIVLLVFQTTRT
jgi:hypothetical protein